MSDTDYLNGIRVVKGGNEVRVVLSSSQSVVGVIGTAPKADGALLPEETPTVFFKLKEAQAAILPNPSAVTSEEEKGTLYSSVESIFNQKIGTIVIVRAKSSGTDDIMNAIDKLLEAESLTSYKPKILCAPGHTANVLTANLAPIVEAAVAAAINPPHPPITTKTTAHISSKVALIA